MTNDQARLYNQGDETCTASTLCDEPCQCDQPSNACDVGTCSTNVADLSLAQRREYAACLQQEVEELKQQIAPLFAEIENFAAAAQEAVAAGGSYTAYVDEIQTRLDALKSIEAAIPAKEADIKACEPSECCIRAANEARKFCGDCGTAMGDIGIACPKCSARNHEDCNFCYNCRTNLKDVSGEICPTCEEAIPPEYSGSFCFKCGTRRGTILIQ